MSNEQGEESYFITIAEGFTAVNVSSGMDVVYRMFTASDFPSNCKKSERPSKLVSPRDPVALKIGEKFPLDRLVVLAVDTAGRPLSPVPITTEIEAKDSPLLNLRTDMIADAKVLPIRAGRFRFRVWTYCFDTSIEIQAEVSKP